MRSSVLLCLVLSAGVLVYALPPIEARNTPSVGEECDFDGHPGTVTKTDDCPGAVSFWKYGPDASVQCCVVAQCTAGENAQSYGRFSCLNTYKKEQCGHGKGKFVPGYCIGDDTVQCCIEDESSRASTDTSYAPTTSQQTDDQSTGNGPKSQDPNAVVVPVIPSPGYSTTDSRTTNPPPGDAVVVPTIESNDGYDHQGGHVQGMRQGDTIVAPVYVNGGHRNTEGDTSLGDTRQEGATVVPTTRPGSDRESTSAASVQGVGGNSVVVPTMDSDHPLGSHRFNSVSNTS